MLDPETLTETDREILTLLTDGRVTAPYVATELDASQEYVRSRLRRLVDHGHAHKVHRGLYELESDPRQPDPEPESAPSRDSTSEPEPESEPDPAPVDPEARIRALDLPGDGVDYERRVDAVLALYDALQARPGERLGKRELADVLEGEDVGYKGGFRSLWSNWIKANSEQDRPNVLASLPGVELRGDDYVYTGERES